MRSDNKILSRHLGHKGFIVSPILALDLHQQLVVHIAAGVHSGNAALQLGLFSGTIPLLLSDFTNQTHDALLQEQLIYALLHWTNIASYVDKVHVSRIFLLHLLQLVK